MRIPEHREWWLPKAMDNLIKWLIIILVLVILVAIFLSIK